MTDAQLDVARAHEAAWAEELGYAKPNTRFVKGRIEYLDEAALPNDSIDVVISKWARGVGGGWGDLGCVIWRVG